MLMLIASPFNEIHKVPLPDPPEPPTAKLEGPQSARMDQARNQNTLDLQDPADLLHGVQGFHIFVGP